MNTQGFKSIAERLDVYALYPKGTAGRSIEQLEGKDWKENRRAAKEAFQKKMKVITPKAEAGDSESQYQLGKYCDYEYGIERDALEEAYWQKKATIQYDGMAMHGLAALYYIVALISFFLTYKEPNIT